MCHELQAEMLRRNTALAAAERADGRNERVKDSYSQGKGERDDYLLQGQLKIEREEEKKVTKRGKEEFS